MDVISAVSILNVAKQYDMFPGEIPEKDSDKIAEATVILEEAIGARDSGFKGEPVASILSIAQFAEGQSIAEKENLPIPESFEGQDPPVLPRDLTNLSNREVRSLYSEFNYFLARVNWLLGKEEADEIAAKNNVEYAQAQAYKNAASTPDPVTGKERKVAALDAEIVTDPDVMEWKERLISHQVNCKLLKSLRDTYSSNCEKLSREWTMREQEG